MNPCGFNSLNGFLSTRLNLHPMSSIRHLLWPVAAVYAGILRCRHFLYDRGIFSSRRGALKTVVLGNVALGGTGKTPHAAFVLKHFAHAGEWAFLSRGYGRATKGFLKIGAHASANEVGDEPLLIARRFAHLDCFVGEKRLKAIDKIAQQTAAKVVVLDDAFQHRELRADCAVVLTSWDRPFFEDHILPVGGLRDLPSRVQAADAVIVTKCPDNILPEARASFSQKLGVGQKPVFFSGLRYGQPVALHEQYAIANGDAVVVVTAIADARLFVEYIQASYSVLAQFEYADHASFTSDHVAAWQAKKSGQYVNVLTTEKDAMRLMLLSLPPDIRVFYIPIEVELLGEGELQRFSEFLHHQLSQ